MLSMALGGASSCVLAQTPTAPPARPANETFFGTEVPDPYRWLEDVKSPEVAAWMKSHSDYTMSLLARIPGRKTMFDRNVKYEEAVPSRVKQVARETGDRWFLERRGASQNQFKLLMRQGLRGEDRVLVDPEAVEKRTGKPHAINYYSTSPGGAFVAYGLSAQGSEAAVLHVLDTRTGKAVGKPIDRADFATVSFSPDSRTLFFNRLQELKPGMPETEKYQKSQVLMITRGADVGSAVPVFGVGVPGVEIGPAEIPIAGVTHDGRWALGLVFNGTQGEIGLFVAPAAGVLAGKPKWRRIIDPRDEVTGVAYFNNTLALLSHKGAPRSQVLRIDLRKPELSDAQVLLAQSDRVVTGITAAADALYIEARDGNVKRLFKRAHAAEGTVVEVKLPVEGSFQLSGDEGALGAADPRFPGLVLELQGWNRARQIYLVAADGSVRNSGLQPEGPFDAPDDVVATEVKVKVTTARWYRCRSFTGAAPRSTAAIRRSSTDTRVTVSPRNRSTA